MAREQMAGRDVTRTARPRTVVIDGLLAGVHYPASRRELVSRAQDELAPIVVVRALTDLPERTYDGPTDVIRELGNFM